MGRSYILVVVLDNANRPFVMRFQNRDAAISAQEFFQGVPGTFVTLIRDEPA
jgi:hypothetical protein